MKRLNLLRLLITGHDAALKAHAKGFLRAHAREFADARGRDARTNALRHRTALGNPRDLARKLGNARNRVHAGHRTARTEVARRGGDQQVLGVDLFPCHGANRSRGTDGGSSRSRRSGSGGQGNRGAAKSYRSTCCAGSNCRCSGHGPSSANGRRTEDRGQCHHSNNAYELVLEELLDRLLDALKELLQEELRQPCFRVKRARTAHGLEQPRLSRGDMRQNRVAITAPGGKVLSHVG